MTEEGEEVAEIDYGDTELRGREHMELEDNAMYLWLRVSHRPDLGERVRLIVTPVQRQCSSTDIFWTPCSSARSRGPCVRRDLLCDGIVNCGQEISSMDESPEVCRSRVKSSPGLGSPRTPSWPRSLSWSASPSSPQGRFSATANMSAKTNENKIVLSQPPAYLEDGCYQNASAPPASTEDNEDSPPSTPR